MTTLVLPSLVFLCVADDPRPAPKLPVGRETTFVNGPLDKSGHVDYEAALNDRLGKDVTPDQNANVLIWKALGPKPGGGAGQLPEYFRRLGTAEPPKDGKYFVSGLSFARRAKFDGDQTRAFFDQQSYATRRAWSAKDFPQVAAWLRENEPPLAVVIEAAHRPKYFNPLVSNRTGDISCLIGCLQPSTAQCRELATALAARALLRTHEGQFDAAWRDLIACHRLGRHLMHGATFLESLVGIAVRHVAANATLAYLERADLTAKQVLAKSKELQDLPAVPTAADKIDLGERLMYLDSLQLIRSGRTGEPGHPTEQELELLKLIDWAPVFRKANTLYDRMAAAMRSTDRRGRDAQFDAIEKEAAEVLRKGRNLDELQKKMRDGDPGKVIGGEIGDVLLAMLMPAVRRVQGSFDRGAQVDRNLLVAFALAAYHKDTGRYPAKLAQLAPKYLADVPNDIFTGKPLIYAPTEKGYSFYSVGENGKDDGGRGRAADPPGDDPGVRFPLPAQKKP